NRQYKTHLLAAMPPFRRSVDLAQTCAFLEAAAASAPGAPLPSARAPKVREPTDVRDDLTMRDTVAIRDVIACPVCSADLSERCRGDDGTLAFLHHARVEAGSEQ